MAIAEQITITIRELHAACEATDGASPEEDVLVSHGEHMILLAWREDDKPQTASIVDGKLTPPEA